MFRGGVVKILALDSSPRPGGNSRTLTARFVDRARALGAEVAVHALNDLDYSGCQACDGCRAGDTPCILDDDLSGILEAVHEADVLVLASPVYFGDVSAQLKGFIDRTRSLLRPDFRTAAVPGRLSPGKQVVFILVQAEEDPAEHADVFARYAPFFSLFNFECSHLVRACGVRERGEVNGRAAVLAAIEELAETIVTDSAG
jgi:multimeric flavodoxin WrbA